MNILDSISEEPSQDVQVVLADNSLVELNLVFLPTIECWMFSMNYGDFDVKGQMLVASANLLRQWRNILPFGLACTSLDGTDPSLLTDFVAGANSAPNCQIIVLSEADVLSVETLVYGVAP